MMKREKIKNDDVSVNFRVDKTLNAKILESAAEENKTLSKYLRDLLEEHHDLSSQKPGGFRSETERFLFSKEFLQFVFWIYSKRMDEARKEGDKIDGYIKLIKRADGILPEEIVRELDKVLVDLFRIKAGSGYDARVYKFPDSYDGDKKLNYKKLEEFFLSHDLGIYLDNMAGYILI